MLVELQILSDPAVVSVPVEVVDHGVVSIANGAGSRVNRLPKGIKRCTLLETAVASLVGSNDDVTVEIWVRPGLDLPIPG